MINVKSNLPEIFPSTDIDQDLNQRASLLLNQTFNAHSSDTGQISSIGSTMSATIVHEQLVRPISIRNVDLKIENNEADILYQWRLRHRFEQAQHDESIIVPYKASNRSNGFSVCSLLPSKPIELPTVISPSIIVSSSPTTNTESTITPVPLRQYSEASTQTLQDIGIQTSLILSIISNEIDLDPTHDDDNQHSSIRSQCEITELPSPVKRHHHTFCPVVIAGHPTIMNTVQSSQVTSIMINENHHQIVNKSNRSATDAIQDDEEIDDDILNILKQKRNELSIQFQQIEQYLADMINI